MPTSNKKPSLDRQKLISKFMDYVLEEEQYPTSPYKFCKYAKIKEEEFYHFFGGIENIKKIIWEILFETTIDVMNKNENYSDLSSREKMLTLFFTFFEMLTMNRSYIVFSLSHHKNGLKNLKTLNGLHTSIKGFAKELIEEGNDDKVFKVTKNPVGLFSEGAWFQFLFLLKFWMDDDSQNFEKTDMAIEKSVHTVFDLFDNTPLDSALDFGKFMFKEKWNWN